MGQLITASHNGEVSQRTQQIIRVEGEVADAAKCQPVWGTQCWEKSSLINIIVIYAGKFAGHQPGLVSVGFLT